jgi:RNA polymerase sigma factor (sigma-70 family)
LIPTIEDIWQGVLADDTRSWRLLVARYGALVLAIALKAGLDRAEAEDCTQQTWLSLYKRRHGLRDPERLPAWLVRVASRTATRMRRRQSRERRALAQTDTPPPATTPDEQLLQLERGLRLEMALFRLGPRCRRLLQAVFYAPPGKSYDDLARELGIPRNSMGPTRQRCLGKLRRIIEKMEQV